MRSNSPYPVRNSPYPSRSSPYPVRNSPYPSRSSPYPRAESRVIVGDLEDSLGGLAQQSSVDVDETQPLLGADKSATTVYTRRWYLLLLFSLVALIQTLIWATWGPISQSAEAAFSWDDSNIAMCVWMGNVPFALFCIPLAWLMDHKGCSSIYFLSHLFSVPPPLPSVFSLSFPPVCLQSHLPSRLSSVPPPSRLSSVPPPLLSVFGPSSPPVCLQSLLPSRLSSVPPPLLSKSFLPSCLSSFPPSPVRLQSLLPSCLSSVHPLRLSSVPPPLLSLVTDSPD